MPDLHHEVPINAAPVKVYAAIATQSGQRSWYTADTQMEEKVGGKAEFGFDKRQLIFRMKIERMVPGKELVLTCHGNHPEWAGTTLTWKVVKEKDATILRLTHSGWKSNTDFCATCNSMWGNLMFRIKEYVEGRDPGPQWRE